MTGIRTCLAAALLAATLATGCGPAAQPLGAATPAADSPPSATPPASPAVGPAGRQPAISPVSASFIDADTGWLLALHPGCQPRDCSWLRMRKTTDGGRHWFAVPAPPARFEYQGRNIPASSVSQVLFGNSSDGWAFGPGLWATHNGGRTWQRLSTHGQYVQQLATAGGRVLAMFTRCNPRNGPCRGFRVFSAAVGSDDWWPVPGAASRAAFGATLVVSGDRGYVMGSPVWTPGGKAVLLTGPADASARWRPVAQPCGTWGWSTALTVTRVTSLVVACGNQPGAGNQSKRAYRSADGGRTWHQLANPPVSGYVGAAALTPAGTIFLSGMRSDVYISWDGGRRWHTSPSLDSADIGDGLSVAMTTGTQDFVLQANYSLHQIWFTYDDGRTWTPVTIR